MFFKLEEKYDIDLIKYSRDIIGVLWLAWFHDGIEGW